MCTCTHAPNVYTHAHAHAHMHLTRTHIHTCACTQKQSQTPKYLEIVMSNSGFFNIFIKACHNPLRGHYMCANTNICKIVTGNSGLFKKVCALITRTSTFWNIKILNILKKRYIHIFVLYLIKWKCYSSWNLPCLFDFEYQMWHFLSMNMFWLLHCSVYS